MACKREKFVCDGNEPSRHRQFLLESDQLLEIVRERNVAGLMGRRVDNVGRDVRIAVAIAAQNRPRQQVFLGPPLA